MRVFVAGATGAVGRQLVPQLLAAGHEVVAASRDPDKAETPRIAGAEVVAMEGLNAKSVREAVTRTEPDIVVHQMTALAGGMDLRHFDRSFAVTNQLRTIGTDNLMAAAGAANVKRFIAQSYTGWNNTRQGGSVKEESDPLDPEPPKAQRQSMVAIKRLEQIVLDAPIDGIVLRYGSLYGPGSSDAFANLVRKRRLPIIGNGTGVWSWLHVDDAASAVVAALDHGSTGIYNVVDDEPAPVSEWLPYLAECLGAKPPMRLPVWVGRLAAGEVGVSMLTQIRGSSNAKAKRDLSWQPRWASWRQGFREALGA